MTLGPYFYLWPVSIIYGAATAFRNLLFDSGLRAAETVGVPVVGIGNLTAGGTGKTPLTAHLIERLLKNGRKPAIVSRGYGGSLAGPVRVPANNANPSQFGDEPTWLAARFPNVPVIVGRDRVAACRFLNSSESKTDLILADDAFQHRRLRRNFDIVVFDATEPLWHYRPLPMGRLREGFSSLKRAHALVLTKTNLVSDDDLKRVRDILDHFVAELNPSLPRFETRASLMGFSSLGGDPSYPLNDLDGKSVVLASGIGRPETFRRLIESQTKARVIAHLIYRDHHDYSDRDRAQILAKARESGADALVVTEKDAVKLQNWHPDLEVRVSQLGLAGDLEGLHAAIDRLVL